MDNLTSELIAAHDHLTARRAELDLSTTCCQPRTRLGHLRGPSAPASHSPTFANSSACSGKGEIHRRVTRMRRRLNGEPLPYTWHGGRTPTERRNLAKLAEDTEPLDELVLGVGAG